MADFHKLSVEKRIFNIGPKLTEIEYQEKRSIPVKHKSQPRLKVRLAIDHRVSKLEMAKIESVAREISTTGSGSQ